MTKKVAVTGAAGQISYSLLFRIASGQLLGPGAKVSLSLLEVDVDAVKRAMEGVAMELDDCAFPTLEGYSLHTDAESCFDGADFVFLVGARPRGKGMERKDLLEANAAIFSVQGKALANSAAKDAKVLVVGNPANTNCLITQRNAKGMDPANFTAMTRLDQNRAMAQVAAHAGKHVSEVQKVVIWGNHSATQFPDIANATVGGAKATEVVDMDWYRNEMIEKVQKRGAEIIEARGSSSAASAASAAIDHMRDWNAGGGEGEWQSMGVVSNGEYGVKEGLVFSYPCVCADGRHKVVDGLEHDDFAKGLLAATEKELVEEHDAIADLL